MHARRTRHGLSALLVAIGLCLSAPALAQGGAREPSAADKATARDLLQRGRQQFAAKDYKAALKSFQGAHAIMGVPTTGLDLARAQAQLGMLLEAQETALEVTRFDNAAGNAAFAKAQGEAKQLADSIGGRIPSIVISVSGPPEGASIVVTIDGQPLPAAALSLPRKINPGKHRVEASAPGFRAAARELTVAEGQSVPLAIALSPATGGKGEVVAPWGEDKPEEQTGDSGGGGAPVWAWVLGGVGVASAGAAIGFGVDFGNAQKTVSRDCPDNQCNASYTDTQAAALQARWNRSLGLTIAFATVSAASLGVATYGFVAGKKKQPEAATAVVPWIGPGGGGALVSGRF